MDCRDLIRTILVQKQNIAASEVDGVGSAQARHYCFHQCRVCGVVGRCLQPPPTTITLGAIMNDGYQKIWDLKGTMYWRKESKMLWRKEAYGTLCGDVYGPDQ